MADEVSSEQENIRVETESGSGNSGSVERTSDEQDVRPTSPRHEATENSGRDMNLPPIGRNPSVLIDEHMEVPPPNLLH